MIQTHIQIELLTLLIDGTETPAGDVGTEAPTGDVVTRRGAAPQRGAKCSGPPPFNFYGCARHTPFNFFNSHGLR